MIETENQREYNRILFIFFNQGTLTNHSLVYHHSHCLLRIVCKYCMYDSECTGSSTMFFLCCTFLLFHKDDNLRLLFHNEGNLFLSVFSNTLLFQEHFEKTDGHFLYSRYFSDPGTEISGTIYHN